MSDKCKENLLKQFSPLIFIETSIGYVKKSGNTKKLVNDVTKYKKQQH